MRKAQQKQRNRTAVTAFPNGMHSTLLELDAITQLQQKSRKQKHITLAWEDHDLADRQNFDDDDVPLGVLFPGKETRSNVNRPIGLMEKRDRDDNEPLSQRRARLRGDVPTFQGPSPLKNQLATTMQALEVSGLTESPVEDLEGETLAQRVKRLRAQKDEGGGVATDFANEVSSQLGLTGDTGVRPAKTKTPDADETLGQRRKRLKEEALGNSRQVSGGSSQVPAPPLQPQLSMAELLAAHVAGGSRKASNESRGVPAWTMRHQLDAQVENPLGTFPLVTPAPMANIPILPGGPLAYAPFNAVMPNSTLRYGNPIMFSPATGMPYGANGLAFSMQDTMMGPPLDPKQRAQIDQWRQGIVQ